MIDWWLVVSVCWFDVWADVRCLEMCHVLKHAIRFAKEFGPRFAARVGGCDVLRSCFETDRARWYDARITGGVANEKHRDFVFSICWNRLSRYDVLGGTGKTTHPTLCGFDDSTAEPFRHPTAPARPCIGCNGYHTGMGCVE